MSPIVAAINVVIGWWAVHRLTLIRDIEGKRRDISLEYLISAYRTLAQEISRRPIYTVRQKEFEDILADLQLFGTNEIVRLARELAVEAALNEKFELDPLMNELRRELRYELKLAPVKENVQWLRRQV